MDEAQWQSEGRVWRGGTVQSDLYSQESSSSSPDQNQNRLIEEGEEVEQGPHGGQKHPRQNSQINNGLEEEEDEDSRVEEDEDDEEMDSTSGACSPELDGQLRHSTSSSPSPTVSEAALSPEDVPLSVLLSPAMSASLQAIEDRGDDALLPHCLHQIAEALVLEGNYERALHFLQLERLYHERVLSNIAALQEQWEGRWRTVGGFEDFVDGTAPPLPLCDLDLEHLEKLRHICRTHRQPSRSVERCELRNSVISERGQEQEKVCVSELPCRREQERTVESDRLMEGQMHQVEVSQDTHSEDDSSSPVIQQRESAQLLQPYPSLTAPPSSALSPIPTVSGAEEKEEKEEEERVEVTHKHTVAQTEPVSLVSPQDTHPSGMEGGEEREDTEQQRKEGAELQKEEEEEEEVEEGVEALKLEAGGEEQEVPEVEIEVSEESPEEEVEEEGLGVETLEVEKVATLDDLAKRIQVEEITPAAGLVSILKRRVSLEGASVPTPTPKPLSKRKVRFRMPEDGLEHDEVGGDSWLLLLLLCLATVVISLGGTALYCAFGDAQSSVCTDFSHNVDFYVGQMQRGVEEVRHWFSPGS